MCAVGVASLASWTQQARADNPDRFYMSGDAALMAGAITADTNDTASVWYNPAGLARAAALRFDVSVSAYALQLGGAPQLEGVGSDTKTDTISVVNFAAVPSALASVTNLGKLKFGFGVFIPQMGVKGLRTRVSRPVGDAQPGFEIDINQYRTTQEMYSGPGIGWHVAPGVDIGMSAFIHYRAILDTQDVRILLRPTETDTILQAGTALTDWLQLGIQPNLGVQLQLSKRVRYGMLFRLPSFRLLQLLGYSETRTFGAGGEVDGTSKFDDEVKIEGRFLTPGRMNGGLSYDAPRLHMALEASYRFPYRNSEVELSERATINGRIGMRYQLKPNLQIGGGLFTNTSTLRNLQNLGDSKINFYGITLASQFGTPYKVSERGSKKLDPPGRLRFGSSFAFTYALGFGHTLHGQAGTFENDQIYRQVAYHVTAHEWILSVGSYLVEH